MKSKHQHLRELIKTIKKDNKTFLIYQCINCKKKIILTLQLGE